MKITNYIIGILAFTVVLTVFSTFIVQLEQEYNPPVNGTSVINDFETLDKSDKLINLTSKLNQSVSNFNTGTNFVDKLEALFSQGYTSMLITYESINFGTEMISEGFSKVPVDAEIKAILIGIGTVILLVLIIGVILSTVTKREQ